MNDNNNSIVVPIEKEEKIVPLEWHTEKRFIKDLKPYSQNPRIMTAKQAQDLQNSIQKFNVVEIPVINLDNKICAGHMRINVLYALGRGDEEVEVRVPNRMLTDEEFREYNIRSNKNIGEFNFDLLAELDEDLLKNIGFDNTELDRIFQLDATPEDDDIPSIPVKIKSKLGEIYQLGRHRIMSGDSTSAGDIAILTNGNKAALGFTSPPYWVGKDYETQKSVEEIEEFISKICEQYDFAVQKDRSRIVINTGTGFTTSFDKRNKRQVLLLIDKWTNNFYKLGWNLRHVRHWIKEGQLMSTSPKSDLIDQHCEFIGTFENDLGEEKLFNDIIPENEINILETFYNRDGLNDGQFRTGRKWALRSFWNDIKGNAKQTGHCAAFPIELVIRHLYLYTKRNDVVLDLFLGSGSTLIACEKTNRICVGMKLLPQYIDVTIERYINYVGTSEHVFRLNEDGTKTPWTEIEGVPIKEMIA